jgi:hypothetical protein
VPLPDGDLACDEDPALTASSAVVPIVADAN